MNCMDMTFDPNDFDFIFDKGFVHRRPTCALFHYFQKKQKVLLIHWRCKMESLFFGSGSADPSQTLNRVFNSPLTRTLTLQGTMDSLICGCSGEASALKLHNNIHKVYPDRVSIGGRVTSFAKFDVLPNTCTHL